MAELRDRLRELYRSRRIVGLANADAANLVEYLNDEDVKFRFFVGDLILRNAKGSLDALISATAESESDEVRRSSVHLLGKIGRNLDDERRVLVGDTICAALKDEDPKVRRNASIALGELAQTQRVASLAEALGSEPFDWVRPSMILALGQIGGTESAAILEDVDPRTAVESEALAKARDRAAVIITQKREPLFTLGREVEFHCAPGQEVVLCDAFEGVIGRRPRIVQNGCVRAEIDALCDLAQVRSWREWLVCVDERTLADRSDACLEREGLDLLVTGLNVCSILYNYAPLTRFRIEVKGKDTSHASRRKLIKAWVDALAKQRPEFANSPSHYEVELRLQRAKTKVGLFLKLTEEPDDRFDYRAADVPAAMHPATAAGIVRMGHRKGDRGRVLDPFCGCGTLLFERARSGIPFDELVGSDISGNAIDAAKANLDHSGQPGLRFLRGDVRSVRIDGSFSELISNLPYGIRTGSHEKNVDTYQALFDRLPEWLDDGARVTLVTQEIDLMKGLFQRTRHVKLVDMRRVDTGGLQPGVFVGVYGKDEPQRH